LTGFRNLLALGAVMIATAGGHNSAWGGVKAAARIELLSIKLVDLDLSDGVSPSLWVPAQGVLPPGWDAATASLPGPVTPDFARYARASLEDVGGGVHTSKSEYLNNEYFLVPSVASDYSPAHRASVAGGTLEARVDGGDGWTYRTASAELSGLNRGWYDYYPGTPFHGIIEFPALILTPNTKLEIIARETAEVARDPACLQGTCGSAFAQASMQVTGNNLLHGEATPKSAESVGVSLSELASGEWSRSVSRDVTVSFTSASESEWISLYIKAYAVEEATSPVPEPATQVLLALGIPLVIALSRRVQRRKGAGLLK